MQRTLRVWQGIALAMALALAVVGASSVRSSNAANRSEVGYIDDVALVNEYLSQKAASEIALVEAETERLQSRFDQERQGLSESETQALFYQYEARLASYRNELFRPYLEQLEEAIAKVAEENGVTVVLSQEAVVLGGVDLNRPVREYLGLMAD